MKIGRNDLCPCGSGKKYKTCCLLKPQNTASENHNEVTDLDENEVTDFDENEVTDFDENEVTDFDENEDTGFDEQEFLINAIGSLHNYFLKNKPHIKEYKKIRKLHGEITDNMIGYFDSGKFERKIDVDYASRSASAHRKYDDAKLNTVTLLESDFNMETHEGAHSFYDMLIYKIAPNMNCITEEFIENHKYRKAEKVEFLQSMLDSKLGLFEVTGTDFAKGYVYMKEVFTGSEYRITDISLSCGNDHDSIYIYTRIITYQNVAFGTGLNLLFRKTDPFIESFIKRQKKSYTPLGEFSRFVELYNRFSKDNNKIKAIVKTY